MTPYVDATLLGRSAERAVLTSALDEGAAGRGGLVLIAGEAGIGKSRLAAATAAEAESRGWPVLHGRAVDMGAPTAYRPLAEALSTAVRRGLGPDAAVIEPFRSTLGTARLGVANGCTGSGGRVLGSGGRSRAPVPCRGRRW